MPRSPENTSGKALNLSVLAFLLFGALFLILTALGASGRKDTPGEYGHPGGDPSMNFERQKSCGLVMGLFWIMLIALGAAWGGRKHLARPLDLALLPGWIKEGLIMLLRRYPYAPWRITGGMALMTGATLLLLLMIQRGERSPGGHSRVE